MKENRAIMGKNIRRLLIEKDITRQELSDRLGISYSTLTDWINGNTYPRIDSIERLANFFGVNKSDLVEEKQSEYFYDEQTAELARELHRNPRMRVLMSASRKTKPEELEALIRIVETMTDED
jgi:transcriptional regulator with XRE-family HTH domain